MENTTLTGAAAKAGLTRAMPNASASIDRATKLKCKNLCKPLDPAILSSQDQVQFLGLPHRKLFLRASAKDLVSVAMRSHVRWRRLAHISQPSHGCRMMRPTRST